MCRGFGLQNKVLDLKIWQGFALIILMTFVQVGCGGESDSEPVTVIASPAGWVLDWSEEFDGTSLNTSVWTHDLGGSGWGNNELQHYQASNAAVANGVLTVTAKQEFVGGKSYTSSRIQTSRKKTFTYGRFEIRAKLPSTKGMWPAFWLLGSTCNAWNLYGGSVNWPKCGEIDAMEMVGGGQNDKKVHGTIHYSNSANQYQNWGHSYTHSANLSNDFHVYAVEWLPTGFTWYIDDKVYGTLAMPTDVSTFKNQTFFILLNLAVGGNWPGNPDRTTELPQSFVIDYVRYFKKI
jgi:beta-glucanase (GH16 family)